MTFLHDTNAVRITSEELRLIAGAEGEYLLNKKDRNEIPRRLTTRFSNHPMKVGAILIRLTALANLLEKEHLLVWVRPMRTTNGALLYNAIFDAAAMLPLILLDNNEITFEHEDFLYRIYASLHDDQNRLCQPATVLTKTGNSE